MDDVPACLCGRDKEEEVKLLAIGRKDSLQGSSCFQLGLLFASTQEYLLMSEDILTLVSETGNVSLYKYKYSIKVYLSLKLILTFSHLRPWEIIGLHGWNPPASAPSLYERPDQLWWHTLVTPGPQET